MEMGSKLIVDLNCDMGEGRGEGMGDDVAMLRLVSSANVACGGHAGDRASLIQVIKEAKKQRVSVGAHPSFPDREGFGRAAVNISSAALTQSVTDQIALAYEVAQAANYPLTHVKAHGALYNLLEENQALASTVAQAIKAVDPGLIWLGLAGRMAEKTAAKEGLRFAREFFADRAYMPDGTLAPRTQKGAVLHVADTVADRTLKAVKTSTITDIYGEPLTVKFDSICVHGDTPGAVEMARKIRETLQGAGITIAPFSQ